MGRSHGEGASLAARRGEGRLQHPSALQEGRGVRLERLPAGSAGRDAARVLLLQLPRGQLRPVAIRRCRVQGVRCGGWTRAAAHLLADREGHPHMAGHVGRPLAVGREEDHAPPLDGARPEDEHVLRRRRLGRREAAGGAAAEGAGRVRLDGARRSGACGRAGGAYGGD